ncbi:MAG: trypsin-like peptidase domain-containing protein [Oscillospiraceae bacterium]|nr:trypsin-like peptidase domain-containing protein [Oscillospiraceae bacterium]
MDNNFDENMTAAQAQPNGNGGEAEPSDTDAAAVGAGNNIPDQPNDFSRQVRELQDTVTDGSLAETGRDVQSVQTEQPVPSAGNPFSEQQVQQTQQVQQAQQMQPSPTGQYGQFQPQNMQQPQQFQQPNQQGFGGSPQYVPPQGYGMNYQPQFGQPPQGGQFGQPAQFGQGGYPQPDQTVQNAQTKKKRFSGGCLWSLIGAVIVMFGAVVFFAVKIASAAETKSVPDNDNVSRYEDLAETQKAEHVVINIPTADKPKLDDADFADKDTGLLTSVGVAKAILPSQVKIKVFDEIPYAPVSSGSGIVLTEDGYILTNAHVVDGAKKLSVAFYGDSESEAVVVGVDKKSDLAVIKVNKTGLSPAQIGTSSNLEIGEEVALAGAGGGFENTVTYGHVTGLGREIDTDYISSSTISCIQSDAALNPGNSGGALVNMYGQVVGVAVALMNHETYENIGFCIAIDDAVPIAEELIAHGYVSTRTRVGITYMAIGDAAANGYGIPAGLCVMEIDQRSGAIYAGLKPYDVITHIDGQRVFGASEIADVLADKVPGDVITISVFRKEVTGETDIFETELELTADTSSISGYGVSSETEDFFGRDIIK